MFREELAAYRATLGDTHPDTLASIENLGTFLRDRGKFDEAELLLREAREAGSGSSESEPDSGSDY